VAYYKIEDFGGPSNRDPSVATIGATAILVAALNACRRLPEFLSNQDRMVSLVCGILMIFGFAWYLVEYYSAIWAPFYALPEDKGFFRFYALGLGLSLVALMPQWPEYWYAYLLVLYIVLYLKKRRTRNLFRQAFSQRYPDATRCEDLPLLAQWKLADAFTRLWLRNGCMVGVAYSVLLFALARMGPRIPLGPIYVSFYAMVSILVTIASLCVWWQKATSHLSRIRSRVEAGDHAYIEDMDF
jgi:multidrug transporter EmrE-like cation transporter